MRVSRVGDFKCNLCAAYNTLTNKKRPTVLLPHLLVLSLINRQPAVPPPQDAPQQLISHLSIGRKRKDLWRGGQRGACSSERRQQSVTLIAADRLLLCTQWQRHVARQCLTPY
jgi:hypothetical protein